MEKESEGALAGYRVLDLADVKGAYCTKLLADLGAEVIKVESPGGDPTRKLPPFAGDLPDLELSLPFLFRNANKLGITLNLETEDGKRILRRLVESADVMVESFTPGFMRELGLDYQSLREFAPRLIMASITEFGQSGPYRDWKGSPIVDIALSTDLIEAGFPDRPPCSLPGMPAYDATSVMAAVPIVLALFERGRTGKGHYIDVSVHENARLALYPWMVTMHSYNRAPDGPPPAPEVRMGAAVYPVYPCKDGYVRVVAITPWQWDAVVKVMGEPEVLRQPEWREFLHRIIHADELYDIMAEFTKNYTMMELFDAGHRASVPIAPIVDLSDFVDSPQTRAREFFLDMDHPVIGKFRYPGPPYKWSESPCRVERSAPCLGEHNVAILCERLGFSRTELAALCRAGVVSGGLEGEVAANESSSEHEVTEGATKYIQAQEERAPVMKRTPLEGIRVVSLGTSGVVPDCVKILGEMGADVIKVESKQNLDMMRTIGGDINGVPGFNEINRNKRSFGVNLKTATGWNLVKELIKKSAVVTENFRVGVVDKLGLDYESVRQIKPDIVYLSSQGFGKTGPYREHKAYGPLMAAASGMLRLWAHPDDPYPVGSTAPIPDHFASKHAVLAILAALDYRRRTGKGQLIDLSLVEAAANLIGASYLEHTVNGRVPQPLGNRSPYAAPYGLYRCEGDDQWCAISVSTEEEWRCFCRAVGRSEWIEDDRFADVVSRLRNVDELDARIEEWTSQHEPGEVMNTLQAAGVAAGVAARSADALIDPQLEHLKAFVEVDHPVAGRRIYPAIPFKISGMTFPESRRAPLFAEHTEEICREILQLSEDEIARLVEEGVIEVAGHASEEEPNR